MAAGACACDLGDALHHHRHSGRHDGDSRCRCHQQQWRRRGRGSAPLVTPLCEHGVDAPAAKGGGDVLAQTQQQTQQQQHRVDLRGCSPARWRQRQRRASAQMRRACRSEGCTPPCRQSDGGDGDDAEDRIDSPLQAALSLLPSQALGGLHVTRGQHASAARHAREEHGTVHDGFGDGDGGVRRLSLPVVLTRVNRWSESPPVGLPSHPPCIATP